MTSAVTDDAEGGRLVVRAAESGLRLDLFLAARLPHYSRSHLQRLIRAGHVHADGKPAKASQVVAVGMTVALMIPPTVPARPEPEALPLSILHDDPDLAVVDKAAGIVVHPAAGHSGGTLVNALLHHVGGLSGIGGEARPGIVHRLDRGTSGVMVIAKNDRAHRLLSKQFHDRTVTKEYVALVWGTMTADTTIERPIGRDPRQRLKMSSRAQGARAAITTVLEVEPLTGVSLVRVRIGTGRTHQIRVHLSEVGHPVVGDALYGGVRRKLSPSLAAVGRLRRPFLHAARLSFDHPQDGRRVSFEAVLPPDLSEVLATLRRVSHATDRP